MTKSFFEQWFGMSQSELVLKLRSLADDLDTLNGPRDRSAPLIYDWTLSRRAVPCLVGRSVGHPTVAAENPMFTGELFYFDEERGIARSFNRWYRLGNRVEPEYWNARFKDRS